MANYFSGTIELLGNLAAQQKQANLAKETPQYQQALFNLIQAQEQAAFQQTVRDMLIRAKNPNEILNILAKYGADTQAAKELSAVEQAPVESYRAGVRERVKQVPDIYETFVNPPTQAIKDYVLGRDIAPFGGIPIREKAQVRISLDPFEQSRQRALGSAAAQAETTLNSVNAIVGDVQDLFTEFDQIPNQYRGPVAGRTIGKGAEFFQLNPSLAQYQADRELTLSNIAKKLGSEVGVLTDRDISRINKAMPDPIDTDETAFKKKVFMYNYMDRRVKSYQKTARLPEEGINIPPEYRDPKFDINKKQDWELIKPRETKIPIGKTVIPDTLLSPEEIILNENGY